MNKHIQINPINIFLEGYHVGKSCAEPFSICLVFMYRSTTPQIMFPIQTAHLWAPAASFSYVGCHLINFKCSEVNSCYCLLHFLPPPKMLPLFIHLLSVPNPTSNLCSSPKFLPSKIQPKTSHFLFICPATTPIQASLIHCLVSVYPFLILASSNSFSIP